MADVFWLSDAQWTVIEPFMPQNQPGPERKDDRRVSSGILHVLNSGCRTTVYNRSNRWSRRGFWRAMLTALAKAGWSGEAAAINATCVKAHCSAEGGKGGARAQAIGPSRGSQTTKVHALVDVLGRPGVLLLTLSNASDVTTAPAVADRRARPHPPLGCGPGLRRGLAARRPTGRRHHAGDPRHPRPQAGDPP